MFTLNWKIKIPNQIPSKVVEYLATGKPIIHFTEIDNDPVIKLSNQFDNLITINKSVEDEKSVTINSRNV